VSRTDRLHLAGVLLIVVSAHTWIAASRYQSAPLVGRQALPTFLAGDGPYYRATLHSIVRDRDLDVRNQFEMVSYAPASNASLGAGGQWYPKHPVLMPVLSAPFFLAAGDRGLLAFNIAQLAALAATMWLLARRFTTALAASLATLVFMLGTMLRPAAYNWSPDVLTTLLTMGAVLSLVAHRMVLAGVLMALGIWAKVPNVLLVPIVAAYAFYTSTRRESMRFVVPLAIGLGLIGVWNWALFGSPIVTSYDRVIAGFVKGQAVLEPSHRTFFDTGLFQGVWTQIIDRRMGLLASAPPLLAGILGLRALYLRNVPMALLIAALMAAQILTFGPYRLWNQSNFGHRFLLTVIALGAVPFAALVDSLLPARAAAEQEPDRRDA
jgi:hypothetical protein